MNDSRRSSTPPIRAALYARVSSEQQAQQETIASQVAALRERVASDGLRMEDELCFLDDGYSGTTLLRPALERLRDQAAAGGFQRLYVHSPDRLARRYAYQVLLVDELRREQVEIVFLNRAIGVSPEEDLLLQMQGMIAEYERAKILESTTAARRCPRRGKRHAAQRGSVSVLGGATLRLPLPAQDQGRRGSVSDRAGTGPRGAAALRAGGPRAAFAGGSLPPPLGSRHAQPRRPPTVEPHGALETVEKPSVFWHCHVRQNEQRPSSVASATAPRTAGDPTTNHDQTARTARRADRDPRAAPGQPGVVRRRAGAVRAESRAPPGTDTPQLLTARPCRMRLLWLRLHRPAKSQICLLPLLGNRPGTDAQRWSSLGRPKSLSQQDGPHRLPRRGRLERCRVAAPESTPLARRTGATLGAARRHAATGEARQANPAV